MQSVIYERLGIKMQLADLLGFDHITIQCHDNPDADALASGYALYTYFKSLEKDVHFIYSGKFPIQKSNLKLMLEHINIPIEYISPVVSPRKGLLITVDCCYGEGNVTHFDADEIAVIDHHQTYWPGPYSEINPLLGSCSTLVWKLLTDAGFDVNADKKLCTALYYGLMTDTGNFADIHYPVDRDMQDALYYDKALISLFVNSNISIDDMVIAGKAMINYTFYSNYKCSVIHADACDPNILGLISDLTLQVDKFDICLVYNELNDGFKISVRSCVKHIRANEFAGYICRGVGSGGGHSDKAGGFISKTKLQELTGNLIIDNFLSERIKTYYEQSEIIDVRNYTPNTDGMRLYAKKRFQLGYVDPTEFLPIGARVTVRTIEGDVDLLVDGSYYIMINIKGEIYPQRIDRFQKSYEFSDEPYNLDTEYIPTLHCHSNGSVYKLNQYAHSCYAHAGAKILARPCNKIVKIFTLWDDENYYLGNPDDYFACRVDAPEDIYIIANDIFNLTYDEVKV